MCVHHGRLPLRKRENCRFTGTISSRPYHVLVVVKITKSTMRMEKNAEGEFGLSILWPKPNIPCIRTKKRSHHLEYKSNSSLLSTAFPHQKNEFPFLLSPSYHHSTPSHFGPGSGFPRQWYSGFFPCVYASTLRTLNREQYLGLLQMDEGIVIYPFISGRVSGNSTESKKDKNFSPEITLLFDHRNTRRPTGT